MAGSARGHWLLSAGRVEPGEAHEEALKRMIKEETSLEIRIVGKVDERVDSYTGEWMANFLCVPSSSNAEISDELEDARWFDPSEIGELEDIHLGLKRFLVEGFRSGLLTDDP